MENPKFEKLEEMIELAEMVGLEVKTRTQHHSSESRKGNVKMLIHEVRPKGVKCEIKWQRGKGWHMVFGYSEKSENTNLEFVKEIVAKYDLKSVNSSTKGVFVEYDFQKYFEIVDDIIVSEDIVGRTTKSYDNYPPAIHGERKWTEEILSDDDDMLDSLMECVGATAHSRLRARPEWRTPEGNRIDLMIRNGEDYFSVEAMDQHGLCDDGHFDKGINSYPMAVREKKGSCTGAIVIAAEFTESQIMRANEINNIGWMIALVTAEEIDGKTTFTLVN